MDLDSFEFDFDFEKQQQDAQVQAKHGKAAPIKFKSIHKRTVCRYWLNNKCSKGVHCEFKHEYDTQNMPECRKGTACPDPSCILSHPAKEDKPLCPNYEAGFCSFGYSCQYRHEHKDVAPALAAMLFKDDPVKQMLEEKRRTQKSFRKAPCPYFESDGWCPYFYACAFRHASNK